MIKFAKLTLSRQITIIILPFSIKRVVLWEKRPTFVATMKVKAIHNREHISAWILLSVFLPMVLLSSLHVHPELVPDGESCHECVTHAVHNGHIMAAKATVDCPLCAFHGQVFLGELETDEQPPIQVTHVVTGCISHPAAAGNPDVYQGRAPPFSFCI